MEEFGVDKYLGVWYELMHYPSWFQRNDNYNTTATYRLIGDNTISVTNRTYSMGDILESEGRGVYLGGFNLSVSFTGEMDDVPNYMIDKIWTGSDGSYQFAVVTNDTKSTLYVLSRSPNPSLTNYGVIMKYVCDNFNRDLLVQTPHYIDRI